MKNNQSTDQFNLIIVGGGMVGLALARALVDVNLVREDSEKLKIAIIESSLPNLSFHLSQQISKNLKNPALENQEVEGEYKPDIRVSAINSAMIHEFVAWGLWGKENFPYRSLYRHMEIWDENSNGKLVFHASDLGQSSLGYILENREIVRVLWEDLKKYPEITFFSPDEWTSLYFLESSLGKNSCWEMSLKSGQKIWGEFLIGADGVNSRIRELLGIDSKPVSYGQAAIVANISSEYSHERTAYQRFLSTGPLAVLPLNLESGSNFGSIVWSTSTLEAEKLMSLSDADFDLALTTALEGRLGQLNLKSERVMFPLRHHHASSYVKKNAILIGDAAHGIHPLAGQGVNLGFHDVRVFKAVLQEAALKNRPLLTQGNLKKIERQLWAHNELIRQSMTGLNAIFSEASQDGEACAKIRNLGMNLVNRFDIVKNLFSKIAQG
jgi:2-octaprenylphenol hydroxylase